MLPVGGAAASMAYAASYVYHDGYLSAGAEAFSTLVPLTSSEGLSYYGSTVCMAAYDTGGNQVGSVLCTTSSTGVGKPYDGTNRYAYARPAAGHAVTAKARAVYN